MVERVFELPVTRSQRPENRHILAYDPRFDITAYCQLFQNQDALEPQEFTRRFEQLNNRTRHNLETNLGERFNVEISRVTYQFVNGQLFNPDHDEPFLEAIKRGQQYRQQCANAQDRTREAAEVTGFEKVQLILTSKHQTPATKVIVASPCGGKNSIYQHNFFDIYQKQEDGTVLMSRFTSKLTYEEFWQLAQELDLSLPTPIKLTDAYFLSHPLLTDKPLEAILELFHHDEKTMKYQEYQKLLKACKSLITAYISNLVQNPDEGKVFPVYNAILNFADRVVGTHSLSLSLISLRSDLQTAQQDNIFKGMTFKTTFKTIEQLVDFYGNQPVRQVTTGCGIQSGFSSSSPITPFSVAEFGITNSSSLEDQYGTLEIHCEECGTTYLRDRGKLEKSCRRCGGTHGIVC